MKYELFDYQEAAKATILEALTRQKEDYLDDSNERGAVSLAAPTGAGKTVIATAVIEAALDCVVTTLDASLATTRLYATTCARLRSIQASDDQHAR